MSRVPAPAAPLPSHISALDGIRGTAILAVMCYHFGFYHNSQGLLDNLWERVMSIGWVGVDLFFVLSGFLITGILLDAKGSSGYFRNFYMRRVLRIFPLYYGFLVLAVWVMPHLVGRSQPEWAILRAHQFWLWSYLTNFLLARPTDWEKLAPGATHFWSLAIEEQFYLVWPAIVWLCSRKNLLRVSVAMMIAAPLLRWLWIVRTGDWHGAYVLTPMRMDTLALGGAVAILFRDHRAWLARVARWALLASAAGFVVMLAILGAWRDSDTTTVVLGYSVFALMCAGLIADVVCNAGWLRRVYEIAPLRFFGKYSYAMYVVHPFFRWVLLVKLRLAQRIPTWLGTELPARFAVLVLGCGLTSLAALASWHLYEKHFLKLKEFFPYGKRPAASPTSRAAAQSSQ
jgi:peptidoglycan/LPS O-acetylase OafA/YrhL